MSVREENIRVRIETVDDLNSTAEKFERLIALEKELVATMRQSQAQAAGQSSAQVTAINSVTDALKKQQQEERRTNDEGSQGRRKAAGEFADLGNSVRNFTTLLGAAFGLNEIKNFGLGVIEAKTKIDSLRIALTTMLGSRREADELYAKVVQLAKATPFTLEEVSEQVAKLKAYNIATEDLIPTITALGNMAAAVGKEKLPQLTLAYGQVANTGRLMGTELKQFTEAGIPLFDLLATSMGKPKQAIIDLQRAHNITFADVRKALLDASEAGGKYAGLMANVAKTVGGEISNMADKFFIAKGRIGDFFEDQIRGGTKAVSGLIDALAGSDNAIRRTTSAVTAAGSAFVTYQIATRASAVASAALLAIETTKEVVYGTYLLVMQRVTQQQIVMTASQMAATTAARGLWVALAANPIGAVVAVVGTLVTAYYAFKAVNEEVTVAMSEQEFGLRRQQEELGRLVTVAQLAKQGTKERAAAIQDLIAKYPEYFSGLSTEKTSNAQLQGILDNVNKSYNNRIALAKEAYKVDKLSEQQRKLWDEEEQAIARLTKRLPELKQYGDDTGKILEVFNKDIVKFRQANGGNGVTSAIDNLINGNPVETMLRTRKGLADIETELKASDGRVKSATDKGREIDITNTKAHYDVLIKAAGGNKAEIAKLKADEHDALDKINGIYHAKDLGDTVIHAKKKAEQAKLSAAELSALLKQQSAETLDEKLKLLDAEEKVEIDAANKSARNKADASARILAIDARYNQQRAVLLAEDRENYSRSIEVDISAFERRNQGEAAYTTIRIQSFKEAAKAAKESEKDIQDVYKETGKIQQETVDIQVKSRKELFDIGLDMVSQQSGLIGQLGQMSKVVFNNLDALSGKAKEAAGVQLADAKNNLSLIQALYDDGGQRTAKQVAEATQQVAVAEQNVAKTTASAMAGTMAMIGVVFQLAAAIGQALDEMYRSTYLSIAEGLSRTRDAYANLYDFIQKTSADAFRAEMAAFTGNITERTAKINEYYAAEKTLIADRSRIDIQLAYNAEMAASAAESGTNVKKAIDGMITAQKNYYINIQQQVIAQAQLELAKAAEIRDAKLAAIDAELKAYTDAKNAQIAKLNETLAIEKSANEQFYSDKQLRLQEDDAYRTQLLAAGQAREVAALEAAKQRELQRATESGATKEELTRITVAFDKLIADKHEEYQTAIGNKAKSVSLANQEAKSQEKDQANKLEQDSADKITALQQQIKDQELSASNEKKKANFEYKMAAINSQREIFEATKQIKVAELRAEIAILRSKRNFLNAGKINAAIDQIEGAIGEISGTSLNYQVNVQEFLEANDLNSRGNPKVPITADGRGALNFPVFDKDGNPIQIAYKDSSEVFTVYDKDKNSVLISQVSGFVPKTGERFFRGTEYVEGLGYASGMDTVPAMLTKGERILTTDQNAALSGITNDALVERNSFYEQFAAQFPDLLNPARWSDIGGLTMQLPPGVMTPSGATTIDVSGLRSEMRAVRSAIENQKTFSVTLDEAGFSKSLIGRQSSTVYVGNLLQR